MKTFIVKDKNCRSAVRKNFRLLSLLLTVAACATSPQRSIHSETSKDFSPTQGFTEVDQLIQVGDYVNALKKMELMKGSISDTQILARWFEKRGTVFSFVGRHQQALQDFDQFTKLINPSFAPSQSELPRNVRVASADKFIFQTSKNYDIILINEAHHVPMHRAFIKTLLMGLKTQGFKYYAAEALNDQDTSLMKRGYALRAETGYYTAEPAFGNLIRDAIQLGFIVTPYESSPKCDPLKEAPAKCQNLREEGQADNLIQRIFSKDKNAKVIVHAGYGHIAKKGEGTWVPMAAYLEKKTGKQILSIDQTRFSERGSVDFEDRAYREALKKTKTNRPFILEANGAPWTPERSRGVYDVMVFHPRSKIIQGRPLWLTHSNELKEVVSKCPDTECLVRVYRTNESRDATPIDQLLARSGQRAAVIVPHNTYRIEMEK